MILGACAEYKTGKIKQIKKKEFYSSKGFALIYSADLFKQGVIAKRLNNNDIVDNKLNHEQIMLSLDKQLL